MLKRVRRRGRTWVMNDAQKRKEERQSVGEE